MSRKKSNKRKSSKGKRSNKSNASRRSVKFQRGPKRTKRARVRGPRGVGLTPVSAPATQAFVQGWREPKFKHRSTGGFRVEHIEFVDDVRGYTTFGESGSMHSIHINPGHTTLFPWLSQIANDFEQYTFHGLTAYYLPAGVGTGTAGTVVVAPDYDANDAVVNVGGTPSISEADLLNFADRQIGVPWAALACKFNKAAMFPTGPRKFVTTGAFSGEDARLDDAALLVWAAYQAGVDGTQFGKLFLHYDVECFIPARDSGDVGDTIGTVEFINTDAPTYTTAVGTAMGDTGTWDAHGNNGILMDGAGVVHLPAGWWLLNAQATFVSSTGTMVSVDMHVHLNGIPVTGGRSEFHSGSGDFQEVPITVQRLIYAPSAGWDVTVYCTATGGGALTIKQYTGSIIFTKM